MRRSIYLLNIDGDGFIPHNRRGGRIECKANDVGGSHLSEESGRIDELGLRAPVRIERIERRITSSSCAIGHGQFHLRPSGQRCHKDRQEREKC